MDGLKSASTPNMNNNNKTTENNKSKSKSKSNNNSNSNSNSNSKCKEVKFAKENKHLKYVESLFESVDFNEERIYFNQFRIIMKMRRPKISERRIRILYNAMCQLKDRDLAVQRIDDMGIGITRDQWQNFYQYVNIEIFRDPKYAVETILDIGQEDLLFAEIVNEDDMLYQDCCMKLCNKCTCNRRSNSNSQSKTPGGPNDDLGQTPGFNRQTTDTASPRGGGGRGGRDKIIPRASSTFVNAHRTPHMPKGGGRGERGKTNRWCTRRSRACLIMCRNFWLRLWLGIRSLLYRMFTHKILSTIIDLTVWVGTIVVIMEISIGKALEFTSSVLVYIFVAEVTLRWIAFGSYFIKDTFNVLDFTVVYLSFALDILIDDDKNVNEQKNASANIIVAFRLLRFLRALATIERFKLIISTSVTVLSNLCILFSLEFAVFYVFAVIGLMVKLFNL